MCIRDRCSSVKCFDTVATLRASALLAVVCSWYCAKNDLSMILRCTFNKMTYRIQNNITYLDNKRRAMSSRKAYVSPINSTKPATHLNDLDKFYKRVFCGPWSIISIYP